MTGWAATGRKSRRLRASVDSSPPPRPWPGSPLRPAARFADRQKEWLRLSSLCPPQNCSLAMRRMTASSPCVAGLGLGTASSRAQCINSGLTLGLGLRVRAARFTGLFPVRCPLRCKALGLYGWLASRLGGDPPPGSFWRLGKGWSWFYSAITMGAP